MFGEKTNLDRAGRKDPTSSHKKSLSGSMSKVSCLNFGIHSRNISRTTPQIYRNSGSFILLFGHKLFKLLSIKSVFLISNASLVSFLGENPDLVDTTHLRYATHLVGPRKRAHYSPPR